MDASIIDVFHNYSGNTLSGIRYKAGSAIGNARTLSANCSFGN
jgi:hypothetical protein